MFVDNFSLFNRLADFRWTRHMDSQSLAHLARLLGISLPTLYKIPQRSFSSYHFAAGMR